MITSIPALLAMHYNAKCGTRPWNKPCRMSPSGGCEPGLGAGSHPAGRVNPFAIELLQKNHLPTEALRSKRWGEFAAPSAPVMDFVFAVCDAAAGEVCPAWPGQTMTAHWGVPDPAAVEGGGQVGGDTNHDNRTRNVRFAWWRKTGGDDRDLRKEPAPPLEEAA